MKQYEITDIKFTPIKRLLWDGKKARFEVWLDSFIPLTGTLFEDPSTGDRWIGLRCVGMRTKENAPLFDWITEAVLSKYSEQDGENNE